MGSSVLKRGEGQGGEGRDGSVGVDELVELITQH